jgi:hypothetical protein
MATGAGDSKSRALGRLLAQKPRARKAMRLASFLFRSAPVPGKIRRPRVPSRPPAGRRGDIRDIRDDIRDDTRVDFA